MIPSGYREISEILSTVDERIVRATRLADGAHVVIKAVTPDASMTVRERLHNHIRLGRSLKIPGIPRILESSDSEGGYIVMEDLGPQTLADLMGHRSLTIIESVTIALGLSRILDLLHRASILHRDVAPQNIAVNPHDMSAGLLDLGIATTLRASEENAQSDVVVGTYAYMAPEQSGRMDRTADTRSDLYSLGCVMYAMLTGHPPFRQRSTSELLHAHAARMAPRVRDARSDVPEVVDELVDLLLKKDPDDRYQTAAGLSHDLEQILLQIRDGGPRVTQLRESDTSSRFHVPDTLFGRDRDIDKIVSAARDIGRSGMPIVVVTGAAGVGKSSTLERSIARLSSDGARVFVGNHERFQDGRPLVGVLDAYRSVIRSILARPEVEVDHWREVYRKALGASAGLFAEAIPELRHLLGEIPRSIQLPPAEARTRFLATMERLATVVRPSGGSVVFVLEDLQWADELTFEMLRAISISEAVHGITVIVSFRTDDGSGEERLQQFLEMLHNVREQPPVVNLGPIDLHATIELVSATLHWSMTEAESLAQILHTQTGGHPLTIRESLLQLYRDGTIAFDNSKRTWTCDVKKAASRNVESVTDLISERLDQLESDVRTYLYHAACVGAVFDPDLVISIANIQAQDAHRIQRYLMQESILFATGDGEMAFTHDRIHQISLELASKEDRALIHKRIHDHLLRWTSSEERAGRLFEITDHGNEAIPLLASATERHELARLNLEAAQQARASSSFASAARYAQSAIDLLNSDGWKSQRSLRAPATLLLGECLSYLGKGADATRLFDEAIANALEPIDRAEAMYHRLGHETTFGNMHTAIDIAIDALEVLGVSIPSHPTRLHTVRALAAARMAQGRRDPETFATEGHLSDDRIRLALRILDMAASSAFYRSTDMISVVFLTRVTLVFKYGHDTESFDAFAHYGMILTLAGALTSGAAFGDLAMQLARQHQNPRTAARAFFVNSATTIHWTRPLAETLRVNRASAEYALEAGDGTYCGFSMGHEIQELVVMGTSFDEIDAILEDRWSHVRRLFPLDVDAPIIVSLFYIQGKRFYEGVKGRASIDDDLSGDGFDHRDHLQELADKRNAAGIAEWYWRLIMVSVLSGRSERVLRYEKEMAPYLYAATGQPFSIDLECWVALGHAELLHRDVHPHPVHGKKRIAAAAKKLRSWAKKAPTAEPRRRLVEGIAHVLHGRIERGRTELIEGLNAAREAQDLLRVALFAEWIGISLERAHLEEATHAYHSIAESAYETVGATVAAQRLRGEEEEIPIEDHSTSRSSITIHQTAQEVDLELVLKASAAIAGEIRLDGLLRTLMDLVLQHAGAQRAILLMHRSSTLTPIAVADIDHGIQQLSSTIDQRDLPMCFPAVQFTDRTQEALVLNDAMGTEPYASDPDIRERHVRSLMVLPLSLQGKPIGVLYLENRLTSHAFTSDRAGVIRLLVGHMAIALENAHLYGQQRATLTAAARFVPSEFLDALGITTIQEVNLGDAVRIRMTVLFADIRRFTSLSEKLSVDDTFGFLNDYLNAVTPAIRQHNGFIDKYIGDAIMALYPGDPNDAVRSALAIQEALTEYNEHRSVNGEAPVHVGIGIHTGDVMLGTVGAQDRLDTTVIGDTVNIAARLEELTKRSDTSIIISEEVRQALPRGLVHVTDLGVETIRGRTAPLQIHGLKPLPKMD